MEPLVLVHSEPGLWAEQGHTGAGGGQDGTEAEALETQMEEATRGT